MDALFGADEIRSMSTKKSSDLKKIPPRTGLGTLIAVLVSTAIWLSTRELTGRYDPQTHPGYLVYAYPLMIVSAMVLGYRFHYRAWLLGFYMMGVQLVLGVLLLAHDLNMLPLGVILHLILAVPCAASAWFGSWFAGKSMWRREKTPV
jgi:hypothetical protein